MPNELTILDLFSGIGGFSLAAESVGGFKTVAFCEIEKYPRSVLERHWDVPVFHDVKELTHERLAHALRNEQDLPAAQRKREEPCGGDAARRDAARGRDGAMGGGTDARPGDVAHPEDERVQGLRPAREQEPAVHAGQKLPVRGGVRGGIDVVVGGFPCQDVSFAGGGSGLDGERSGLYSEMLRVVREVGARYVLMENVSALLVRGLGRVLGDLAQMGYDAEWGCVKASDLGSPHKRDRIWILAYPTGSFDQPVHAEYVLRRLDHIKSCEDSTWRTLHGMSPDGKSNGPSGNELGRQVNQWATWPTPTGGSKRKQSSPGLDGGAYSRSMLEESYGIEGRKALTSSLNPDWVEMLMGYEVGWTSPDGPPMSQMARAWPAGRGASQYDWEPPRLTAVKEHRANRLKALGNSIVPQVAALWFEAILFNLEDNRCL